MARDLNKVMLIGRLAQDIEIKKIPDSGRSVASFSLATNRRYKNAEGNMVDEVEYHRCVAYGQVADILGQYLSKGRRVYLEGRLKTRKWEDSTGQIRYTTEIIVEDFIFLDSKINSNNSLMENNTSNSENKNDNQNISSMENEDDLPF